MALTKSDLITALNQQRKEIIAEISEFLEKHVIEPIFELRKDVSGLKKDVSGLKQDVVGLKQGMEKIEIELEQKAPTTLVNNVEESILTRIDKAERNIGKKFQDHEKRITHLEETYV